MENFNTKNLGNKKIDWNEENKKENAEHPEELNEKKLFASKKESEEITLSPEMKDIYERMCFTLFASSKDLQERSSTGERINKQIYESIKNNEYDTVIAEDASGRIPGLIMYEFFKKVAEKENKPIPQIYFMAGSFNAKNIENKRKITNEYIKDTALKNHNLDKKILVVTEYIMTGNSLKPITDGLKEQNINYDILTLGLSKEHWHMDAIRDKLGNVSAALREIPKSIFRREDLSGVIKNEDEVVSKKSTTADQAVVNHIRKEIHIVAENLYKYSGLRNKNNS